MTRVSFAPVAFVEVRGLRLHYQEWGPADAQAGIVLVHGLGSSCHIWDFVAPLLAEPSPPADGTRLDGTPVDGTSPRRTSQGLSPGQGLRVVALDQRGHGQSDQPDSGYDFASVVADLAEFVDAVGLSGRSVFVGHSWGASVVLHFAVSRSEEHTSELSHIPLSRMPSSA